MLRQEAAPTDAALATMLALTVVEPQSSGIGGGGFLVITMRAARPPPSTAARKRRMRPPPTISSATAGRCPLRGNSRRQERRRAGQYPA